MDIQELIAGLKEKGMADEEIKATLEDIKSQIDAFLNPAQEGSPDEPVEETEDEKRTRVFGLE